MSKLDESKRASVRPSELLAAAAAIAAGTQAYGEVVIFINPDPGEPGHFNWMSGDEFAPSTWIDITRPPTDQGGVVGPTSVGQLGSRYTFTFNGAAVATDGYTQALLAGATVDGQLLFSTYSIHLYFSQGGDEGGNELSSNFPSGVARYMGVRFNDVDGYHYGWISVVRNGLDLDAFAWGYETEPGVPIIAGIPAPGTLAALAFGAVVTRRARKRKDD